MKNAMYGFHSRPGQSAHTRQTEMIETDAALALKEAIRLSRLAAKTVDYTYTKAETPRIEFVDSSAETLEKLEVWADEAIIGMGIVLYAQSLQHSEPTGGFGYYAHTKFRENSVPDITYYQAYDGIIPARSLNPADRIEVARNFSAMSHMILQAQDEQFFTGSIS